MEKGLVKVSKETPKFNNDKGKFWSQNKNATNDEVVDAKVIKKCHPTIYHKVPSTSNTPNTSNTQTQSQDKTLNSIQNNQQCRGPPHTKRTYNPMGEPIELFLKKLL